MQPFKVEPGRVSYQIDGVVLVFGMRTHPRTGRSELQELSRINFGGGSPRPRLPRHAVADARQQAAAILRDQRATATARRSQLPLPLSK